MAGRRASGHEGTKQTDSERHMNYVHTGTVWKGNQPCHAREVRTATKSSYESSMIFCEPSTVRICAARSSDRTANTNMETSATQTLVSTRNVGSETIFPFVGRVKYVIRLFGLQKRKGKHSLEYQNTLSVLKTHTHTFLP